MGGNFKRKLRVKRDQPDVDSFLIGSHQIPIVYSHHYNITFCGMEKLHPFDSGKWGRVHQFLKEADFLKDGVNSVEPQEATDEMLLKVHPQSYLNRLKWSSYVAQVTEVLPVALLPNFVVQRKVLKPLRFQTGGTILSGKLAVERGWSINIGGGFHHCSAESGGGFCAYADITLVIKFLFDKHASVSKVMIVDLDAHQGNGHERDFMDEEKVYIMDVYNCLIYPNDTYAKAAIKKPVELMHSVEDIEYLSKVDRNLDQALNEFHPDVIVFNAGTDILRGDRLGHLSISPEGIIERDEMVWKKARENGIAIIMVTSGGYQRETARVIADSILNLGNKGYLA